jgi:3-deoxy-D-manno-octulosonic acid kinase
VAELLLLERLRVLGIPTIEPLAAAAHWLVPGCYRGAFVSREIPLAVTLWQYLREVDGPERQRICQTAARATRLLHDAGVIHPDLNLQNYLVRRAASGREVLIIDFDRARLARPSARDRQVAFERLCRSMRKLDPEAAVLTLGCVEAFHTVAEPERRADC